MIKCGLCNNEDCIDDAEDTCIGFVPMQTIVLESEVE